MASELCMNCFSVKGQYEVCPYCGYVEGTPPKQPHYLTPGTLLGNRFMVGTAIGVGGFGITYKCFDTTLGVQVAVKEFYPVGLVNRAPGERRVGLLSGEKEGQYRERLQRFLMEAQSVAQFGKAKDIVNVFDFFEENGTAYIIMEYIDGVLLKDYLDKQGVIDPEAALAIIMPIIEAVKKIHSKEIIHRDISPDNIFISSENEIKVFDFGAAILNNSKEGMDAEPVIKVGYSPLEQYRDKGRQGFYTDVYAVGAILYQMLTGVKPIESTEREFKDELKSPRELGVKISANMDRAVMEALSVRPELRFQGIQQFQEALLNKRMAEYPKEKIRKRKRTRNWVISLSVTAALAVGVGIALYSTVLKPQNQIFDEPVKAGTAITVWVENNDQKKQIEDLVENGFRQGKTEKKDEKIRKMQEEDADVSVTVQVQKDMEAALKEAKEDENRPLPDMFLSDHVSNLEEYRLVSMKDNVYASLDTDQYLFLSEYEKRYANMKEMPTGIDTLLLYACQFDYNKDNALIDSEYYEDSASESTGPSENGTQTYSVELSDLCFDTGDYVLAEDKLNNQLAYVTNQSLADVLLLADYPEWKGVMLKHTSPKQEMLDQASAIQEFRKAAGKKKFRINTNQKRRLFGSNLLAGVGYRALMSEAQEIGQDQEKGANPLGKYKPYVVTQDGKMLVKFSERYAIMGESSKDQQTACMRLLWVMLSGAGQEKKYMQGQTTYPILRSKFEEFAVYNANYDGFIEMVKDHHECVLVGEEAQEAQAFANGLQGQVTEDEIREYCEKYLSE